MVSSSKNCPCRHHVDCCSIPTCSTARRQFITRHKVNSDILTAFHQQLREYFVSGHPERRSAEGRLLPTGRKNGLPTVAYFADKACLSPNYFGDLISKESGTTVK